MTHQPATIPVSIIDRSYLIPVSEEAGSDYFPMSPVVVIKLRTRITESDLIEALLAITNKYPRLRTGYKLNTEKLHWQSIPQNNLRQHFTDCVHTIKDDTGVSEVVSRLLCFNNPLSQPVNWFINDRYLYSRMHHSFGDGRFMFLLFQYLVAQLEDNDAPLIPLSDHWWMSIAKVIWQNVTTARTVYGNFLRSISGQVEDYQKDTSVDAPGMERMPIVSGSRMVTCLDGLDAETVMMIHRKRKDWGVSFNTIAQILMGQALIENGHLQSPVIYTVPVDIRQYIDEENFITGNLATQIRITIDTDDNLKETAILFNDLVNLDRENYVALSGIPAEWLLKLSGSKTYEAINRDWLLKSTRTDPRFFVLSNPGVLDAILEPIQTMLADDFIPYIFTPLMGGPPFVMNICTWQDSSSLSITYNPQVLTSEQVATIVTRFKHLCHQPDHKI